MFKSQDSDRNKWGLWIFWMKLQNALIEIVYRRIRKISKVLKNKSWLRHFLKRRNSNPPLRGPWPFLQSTLPTETGDLQRIEIFCLYSSSECCMSIVFTNAETQLYWKHSDFASKMKSVRLSFQSFYGWPMVSIFAKPVFHMMMHAKAKPKDTIKNLKSLSTATLILNLQDLSHFLYWSNLSCIDLVVLLLTAMS